MPKQTTSGKFGFEQVFSIRGKSNAAPDPETPFRILVMGDFSGRGRRGVPGKEAPSRLRLYRVDRENMDEIMGKLGAEVRLPLHGANNPPEIVRFSNLDGFHPDSLFERMEIFQTIRDSRKILQDPSYVPGTGQEERAAAPAEKSELSLEKLLNEETPSGTGVLDSLLQRDSGIGARHAAPGEIPELDRFLKQVVKPHVDSHAEERKSVLKVIDDTTGALMQAILRYPDFQDIEAAWRGLDFMLSRIETDEDLEVFLLDVSKAELAADLCAAGGLAGSAIHGVIVEQTVGTPGGKPWALIAGNYVFECGAPDIDLLGRMAKIAEAAGAPFIAEAGTGLLGCDSPARLSDPSGWKRAEAESKAWEALRSLPEASGIGLALPGFLLRLPYGAKTEPVESFSFEEFQAQPEHGHYLWGNPCFFCACLLAQGFKEEGWGFRPDIVLELNDLPVHIYQDGDETKSKPCAGVLLSHTAAEAFLDNGIMPLLSFRDQDRVRLGRFQSIADPPGRLSGRWG